METHGPGSPLLVWLNLRHWRLPGPLVLPSVPCLGVYSHTSREQSWGFLPGPSSPFTCWPLDMGVFPLKL